MREYLAGEIAKYYWWHSIDLGGGIRFAYQRASDRSSLEARRGRDWLAYNPRNSSTVQKAVMPMVIQSTKAAAPATIAATGAGTYARARLRSEPRIVARESKRWGLDVKSIRSGKRTSNRDESTRSSWQTKIKVIGNPL